MRNKMKRNIVCIMIMALLGGISLISVKGVKAATVTNKVPITAYVKGYSSVRTYSGVNGSATGWIYSSDKCTILNVYSSGWCRVKYPVSKGYRTAYTRSNYFLADTNFSTATTNPEKICLYMENQTLQ